MYENGFYYLYNLQTNKNNDSQTLIDLAQTNIFNHSIQNGIVVDNIADQYASNIRDQLFSS